MSSSKSSYTVLTQMDSRCSICVLSKISTWVSNHCIQQKPFFFFFCKVLNKSIHKNLLGSSRKCVGVLLTGQAMVLAALTSWDS